jgi:hypothetical protein
MIQIAHSIASKSIACLTPRKAIGSLIALKRQYANRFVAGSTQTINQ